MKVGSCDNAANPLYGLDLLKHEALKRKILDGEGGRAWSSRSMLHSHCSQDRVGDVVAGDVGIQQEQEIL